MRVGSNGIDFNGIFDSPAAQKARDEFDKAERDLREVDDQIRQAWRP